MMGTATLSCCTPSMVEKEMWIYLVSDNLIRLLVAQSALLANITPRQVSFKHTLQLWVAWQVGAVAKVALATKEIG
jgi:hypothetical protein